MTRRRKRSNGGTRHVKLNAYGSPTPERMSRAGLDFEFFNADIDQHTHYDTIRLTDESALEKMRGTLTGDQYNACNMFYCDWYVSGMAASGVIDLTREYVDHYRAVEMSDRKLDAMTRFNAAMRGVGRLPLRPIIAIVLFNVRFADYGRRYGPHSNSKLATVWAKGQFDGAANALVYHYFGRRDQQVVTAHAEDYRPRMRATA